MYVCERPYLNLFKINQENGIKINKNKNLYGIPLKLDENIKYSI